VPLELAAGGTIRSRPSVAKLPRFPALRERDQGFRRAYHVGEQLGDNWHVYEPALEAMQDQILDCVEDSYPIRSASSSPLG